LPAGGVLALAFSFDIASGVPLISRGGSSAPPRRTVKGPADVRKLVASGADEAYLRAWSAKLGVDALLRRCMDAGYDP
jgi:hypothetical protein